MDMKTLTWSDFAEHGTCYDPQEKYGDWSGTILDLLRRDDIPAKDRIWAFTRKGIVDERTQRLFACKCVRDTPLDDGRKVWDLLTDDRSRNAVEIAERFANGEATLEELNAAWDAARAAGDAAWASQVQFAIDLLTSN